MSWKTFGTNLIKLTDSLNYLNFHKLLFPLLKLLEILNLGKHEKFLTVLLALGACVPYTAVNPICLSCRFNEIFFKLTLSCESKRGSGENQD